MWQTLVFVSNRHMLSQGSGRAAVLLIRLFLLHLVCHLCAIHGFWPDACGGHQSSVSVSYQVWSTGPYGKVCCQCILVCQLWRGFLLRMGVLFIRCYWRFQPFLVCAVNGCFAHSGLLAVSAIVFSCCEWAFCSFCVIGGFSHCIFEL